jgi:16S rRNA (uracil1498-N3)-methyltransferase
MRCFVPPSDWSTGEVVLGSEESHHLLRVMRARVGDPVGVFDGAGHEGSAEVTDISNRHAVVVTLREDRFLPRSPVVISIVQALAREQKMDLVLQKGVELGAGAIHPVLTSRSLVRLDRRQAEERVERWNRIALNAAKQCGAAWLPEISVPQPLSSYLEARAGGGVDLLCSLRSDAVPLREVLRKMDWSAAPRVTLFVGPEGDFTDEEETAVRGLGATPVNLGPLVLRTETAALYALGAVRYESLP